MLAKNITSKAETNSDSGISTGNNSINMSIKFYDDQVYSEFLKIFYLNMGQILLHQKKTKCTQYFEYLLENYPEMEGDKPLLCNLQNSDN